jgi:hypothetical protein
VRGRRNFPEAGQFLQPPRCALDRSGTVPKDALHIRERGPLQRHQKPAWRRSRDPARKKSKLTLAARGPSHGSRDRASIYDASLKQTAASHGRTDRERCECGSRPSSAVRIGDIELWAGCRAGSPDTHRIRPSSYLMMHAALLFSGALGFAHRVRSSHVRVRIGVSRTYSGRQR